MKLLDQTKDYYLRNSCILAWLLHIVQLNFWIPVNPNMLMKLAIWAETSMLWFPNFWWYFEPLYNWFIKEMNKKLWLNFKMEKQFVQSFNKDTMSYWFWSKNYSKIWKDAEERGELTMQDVEEMKTYEWKTVFHHLVYDYSKRWHIANSMWLEPFKCDLNVFQALEVNWFIYSPMRTIKPADKFTQNVVELTRQMARYELQWRLQEYLDDILNVETNEVTKAKELYFYWRGY